MLRGDKMQALRAHLNRRGEAIRETLRLSQFGADGSGVPASMVELKTEQDRDVWARYLSKHARMEVEGQQPGDAATRAVMHPAVQEMVTEEPDDVR